MNSKFGGKSNKEDIQHSQAYIMSNSIIIQGDLINSNVSLKKLNDELKQSLSKEINKNLLLIDENRSLKMKQDYTDENSCHNSKSMTNKNKNETEPNICKSYSKLIPSVQELLSIIKTNGDERVLKASKLVEQSITPFLYHENFEEQRQILGNKIIRS